MDTIEVGPDGIRLGQLLKLTGVAGTGGEAKLILESGDVQVNGRSETRRGAQLKAGDVVALPGVQLRLTSP